VGLSPWQAGFIFPTPRRATRQASQSLVSSHPVRVLALVLISTPASLADKPAVAAMWDEVSNLEDPLNPAFVDQFVCSFPEALPDEFLDLLVSESLKVPASDRKETLRGLTAADSSVIMNRITAPTLLISADEDAFVSEDQEIIRRAVPDARLQIYKGAGHAVHLARPDRIVDDVVDFVAKTVTTTGS
jgi:pimeloyl-ACP methyl ester carboxylesterase